MASLSYALVGSGTCARLGVYCVNLFSDCLLLLPLSPLLPLLVVLSWLGKLIADVLQSNLDWASLS